MTYRTFQIIGKITDSSNYHRVFNLRIEAWDKDLIIDDFLGSAITDENGSFMIEFSDKSFRELFFDRKPDLYFKVFNGDVLLKSTEDTVLWNIDNAIMINIDLTNKPLRFLEKIASFRGRASRK